MTKTYAIVQVLTACLVVAAWYMGWVDLMLNSDKTYIVELIMILSIVSINIGPRWPKTMKWISGFLPLLGMVGTLIGFMVGFSGEVNAANMMDPEGFKELVGQMLSGLGTALSTTLVGVICFMWLEVSRRCLNR